MRATCQQTTQVVLCFRLVGMLLAVLEHVPLAVGVAAAEGPRFSNVFMSHMVLQHGRPISLWGWGASSHAQLEVSLGNHSTEATVNASDGSWHATLPTMAPPPTLSERLLQPKVAAAGVAAWALGLLAMDWKWHHGKQRVGHDHSPQNLGCTFQTFCDNLAQNLDCVFQRVERYSLRAQG
eukprot:COSAG05_NODE_4133_length_1659_cov_1.255769_1_plen_179_part_10